MNVLSEFAIGLEEFLLVKIHSKNYLLSILYEKGDKISLCNHFSRLQFLYIAGDMYRSLVLFCSFIIFLGDKLLFNYFISFYGSFTCSFKV